MQGWDTEGKLSVKGTKTVKARACFREKGVMQGAGDGEVRGADL